MLSQTVPATEADSATDLMYVPAEKKNIEGWAQSGVAFKLIGLLFLGVLEENSIFCLRLGDVAGTVRKPDSIFNL